ncbi:MAG: hypothetical protein ACUVUG_02880 [Candidatus Aminicenantia bacterium]
MKKTFSVLFIILIAIPLFSQERLPKDIGMYFCASSFFSSIPSKFKDDGDKTFSILSGEIGLGFTLFEDLSIEGRMGYSLLSLSRETSFSKLPLEVAQELNFSGINFAIEAMYSNLFEFQDFGLSPFLSFYFGSSFEKKWEIELPIVKGEAIGSTKWLKGIAGGKIYYNGLDLHTPYLGIYLMKNFGSAKMKEEIEEIKAEQERKFNEKLPLVLSIGDELEIKEDLYVNGELKLFGEYSFLVSLKYIFK